MNFDYTFNFSRLRVPIPPKQQRDFSESDALERVIFDDAPELNGVISLQNMHSLSGRLTAIEREYTMNVVLCETKISSLLCDVFCDVLRALRTESALGGEGKLDAIIRYVHEHYREPLTNGLLGEVFGFHKNYVSSMIKGYTGMPLHKYLNYVRISHALDMLSDGDVPIEQVAADCGFCDVYYFSRYFKNSVGVSPTGYKKGKDAERSFECTQ